MSLSLYPQSSCDSDSDGPVLSAMPIHASVPDNVAPGQGRAGRWSVSEQVAFLRGLRRYGKGQWKQIGKEIPTR